MTPHYCRLMIGDAGHDRNGNPRRVIWCPECKHAVDEGYEGDGPERIARDFPRFARLIDAPRVKIPYKQYRQLLNQAQKG